MMQWKRELPVQDKGIAGSLQFSLFRSRLSNDGMKQNQLDSWRIRSRCPRRRERHAAAAPTRDEMSPVHFASKPWYRSVQGTR
jgi:hypothetical protein